MNRSSNQLLKPVVTDVIEAVNTMLISRYCSNNNYLLSKDGAHSHLESCCCPLD